MKIKETPTALAILVFSWLIAFFGILTGSYIVISGSFEFRSLARGLFMLLGSLLLAAMVRMFANIGQILFDLKANMVENQKIFIASSGQLQDIKKGLAILALTHKETREIIRQVITDINQNICSELLRDARETREIIRQAITGMNQNICSELSRDAKESRESSAKLGQLILNGLQAINQEISALAQNSKDTKAVLDQSIARLNESLLSELQAINRGLPVISLNTQETEQAVISLNQSFSRNLNEIEQGLSTLAQVHKETREIISQAMIKLNRDLAQNTIETKETGSELQKVITNSLGESKNVLEEINCDSEDMSQNIFHMKDSLGQLNGDMKDSLGQLSSDIKDNLGQLSSGITDSLGQLSSDSKAINQSIHQIKTFFEQIEKHLDLKK